LAKRPLNLTKSKIASVVVTYQPDARFSQTISKVAEQSEKVFIIDNGSKSFEDLLPNLADYNVYVHKNKSNVGLATALNQGIIKALDEGYDWIATFDQDSLICDNYFELLFSEYLTQRDNEKIAIVTGTHLDLNTGCLLNPRESNKQAAFIPVAISSGNVIKANAFKKIGFFDESLFIDYLDHDFCFRLRKNSFKILEASSATILHQLGGSKWHRIGPITFMSTHHSPLRRYFMSRNRMIVYWRHWRLDPKWVANDIMNLFKEIGKIVLAENQKFKKICYIFMGILQIKISPQRHKI